MPQKINGNDNIMYYKLDILTVKPYCQPKQAGCGEYPKTCVLRILASSFSVMIRDKIREPSFVYLLLTPLLSQIRDPWLSHVFTISHIVIGLSLHIHSFIHLKENRNMVHWVKP